ncbi:unnamed protein product, partial [Prorocentrum cordatum]
MRAAASAVLGSLLLLCAAGGAGALHARELSVASPGKRRAGHTGARAKDAKDVEVKAEQEANELKALKAALEERKVALRKAGQTKLQINQNPKVVKMVERLKLLKAKKADAHTVDKPEEDEKKEGGAQPVVEKTEQDVESTGAKKAEKPGDELGALGAALMEKKAALAKAGQTKLQINQNPKVVKMVERIKLLKAKKANAHTEDKAVREKKEGATNTVAVSNELAALGAALMEKKAALTQAGQTKLQVNRNPKVVKMVERIKILKMMKANPHTEDKPEEEKTDALGFAEAGGDAEHKHQKHNALRAKNAAQDEIWPFGKKKRKDNASASATGSESQLPGSGEESQAQPPAEVADSETQPAAAAAEEAQPEADSQTQPNPAAAADAEPKQSTEEADSEAQPAPVVAEESVTKQPSVDEADSPAATAAEESEPQQPSDESDSESQPAPAAPEGEGVSYKLDVAEAPEPKQSSDDADSETQPAPAAAEEPETEQPSDEADSEAQPATAASEEPEPTKPSDEADSEAQTAPAASEEAEPQQPSDESDSESQPAPAASEGEGVSYKLDDAEASEPEQSSDEAGSEAQAAPAAAEEPKPEQPSDEADSAPQTAAAAAEEPQPLSDDDQESSPEPQSQLQGLWDEAGTQPGAEASAAAAAEAPAAAEEAEAAPAPAAEAVEAVEREPEPSTTAAQLKAQLETSDGAPLAAVHHGLPSKPGCWMKMPSGCPKQPMRTQAWRRDAWAEQQGLGEPGCARRKQTWDRYCGTVDAKMLYVAAPAADAAPAEAAVPAAAAADAAPAEPAAPAAAAAPAKLVAVAENRSAFEGEWPRWPGHGGADKKAAEATKADTIAAIPKAAGCYMRMPSGCPQHPLKTDAWRR